MPGNLEFVAYVPAAHRRWGQVLETEERAKALASCERLQTTRSTLHLKTKASVKSDNQGRGVAIFSHAAPPALRTPPRRTTVLVLEAVLVVTVEESS
jgi:hypothetical protein